MILELERGVREETTGRWMQVGNKNKQKQDQAFNFTHFTQDLLIHMHLL